MGFITLLLVFAAATAAAYLVAGRFTGPQETLRARLEAYRRHEPLPKAHRLPRGPGGPLALKLAQADLPWRPEEFLGLMLGLTVAGALAGLTLLRHPLAAVALALAGYALPALWLDLRRHARRRTLSAQVPQALSTISHALRAGYGLTQGLQAVATDMPRPISLEFRRTLHELALGLPLEEVLENLQHRAQSDDLEMAITGILINREVGGNLAELLDRIAETIRERVRLQNQIRILTIQGKISALAAALFPPGMVGILYLLNPAYESILFTTGIGLAMVAIALAMQVIGALMVWRIVNIQA